MTPNFDMMLTEFIAAYVAAHPKVVEEGVRRGLERAVAGGTAQPTTAQPAVPRKRQARKNRAQKNNSTHAERSAQAKKAWETRRKNAANGLPNHAALGT